MSPTPTNTGAVLKTAQAPHLEVASVPYPTLRPNAVIIQAAAAAINPVDWKVKDFAFVPLTYPAVLGTDVAGVIVEVGSEVNGLHVGQRVLAYAGYFLDGVATGTFQQYVLALGVVTVPIPDSLSFESAAVIPLCFSTAAAGLYEKDLLALSYPSSTERKDEVIFVWGGSTSVGSAAIQLARASGYEVMSSAGAHNKDYVIELGILPEFVFDHKGNDIVKEVASALRGRKLIGVIDCVTDDDTKRTCRSIARAGGIETVIGVLPGDAEVLHGVAYKSIRSITVWFSEVAPALFAGYLERALKEGKYLARPEPVVVGHGLEHVSKALDILKAGVSAKKLVVTF